MASSDDIAQSGDKLTASVPMTQLAYQEIRQRIMDNEWPAGMQATEKEVATRLGMSRTPVREALMRLQHEGLVNVVPRHGMRVLPVSAEDMAQIYTILTSLEATAAELVAARRLGAAALQPLRTASDDMDRALQQEDLDAWAQADERFHRHLLDLCGNTMLRNIVLNFWDRAHRARMVTLRLRTRPANSTREHAALVDALQRGDAPAAALIQREHRQRAGDELLHILKNTGLHQL
ncbi:GntR family transcriptional regulator [Paraburkholderia sp.]|uniref:GntR family transcriptional regulator n=1 Tax=Paraburkholderia sp. TaxID=1926495 RepID=UPI0039E6FAD6